MPQTLTMSRKLTLPLIVPSQPKVLIILAAFLSWLQHGLFSREGSTGKRGGE